MTQASTKPAQAPTAEPAARDREAPLPARPLRHGRGALVPIGPPPEPPPVPVTPTVPGMLAWACGFVVAVAVHPWVTTGVAVLVTLCTVPGWLLTRAVGLRAGWTVRGVIYSVTSSLAILLLLGLVANTALPVLGVSRPLAAAPFTATLVVCCLALAVAARRRGALTVSRPRGLHPSRLAPLAAPIVTAAGTLELNTTGRPELVTLGLLASGALLLHALATARTLRTQDRLPFVLYAVSLSLLWSYSLRTVGLFGFDVRQEYAHFAQTAAALHWVPLDGDAYAAMLSITTLPTVLSQLTGISGLTLFKVVLPALFGLFPVGVYALARRWLRPTAACVAACTVVLQVSFAPQLPALGRQEIALLLYVGMLLIMLDPDEGLARSRVLLLVLGTGMIVSHYSTTYVALAALVGARLVTYWLRRGRGPGPPAVAAPALIAVLVTVAALWYGVVTHSAQNLGALASSIGSTSSHVDSQRATSSWLQSWLAGNTVDYVEPRQYYDAVGKVYAEQYPWLDPYSRQQQAQISDRAVSAPTGAQLLPGAGLLQPLTTIMRQLVNLGTAMGVLWIAFRSRRRDGYRELAGLALPLLMVTVLIRTSAAVAFAYNPERLALQTSALMVIPLALAVQHARLGIHATLGRALAGAALAGVVTLGYLDASGLGARAAGDLPGNLSASGEVSERLASTEADLLAAAWVGRSTPRSAALYADRYGALLLTAHDGGGRPPVLDDLTPATIDRRAYVYATTVNVTLGRARGATPDGTQFAVYPFPAPFLASRVAVVYDTGTARVYK